MGKNDQDLTDIRLTLIGCGRMGGALLKGWLRHGLDHSNVTVLDPRPSDWLKEQEAQGITVNPDDFAATGVVVLATKPQYVADAVQAIGAQADENTVLISIAAGVTMAQIEDMVAAPISIVRAMPNTPAEVGCGMTGLVANRINIKPALTLARKLMQAVGCVVEVDDEDQMHAVTALSGSGPAFVFAMAEALEASGIKLGLSQKTARTLAVQTIKGAGVLMASSNQHASQLREAVTSPGGTTAAGLAVMQADDSGIQTLISQTTQATAARSRALADSANS